MTNLFRFSSVGFYLSSTGQMIVAQLLELPAIRKKITMRMSVYFVRHGHEQNPMEGRIYILYECKFAASWLSLISHNSGRCFIYANSGETHFDWLRSVLLRYQQWAWRRHVIFWVNYRDSSDVWFNFNYNFQGCCAEMKFDHRDTNGTGKWALGNFEWSVTENKFILR